MLIKVEVHPESKEERIETKGEMSSEFWVKEKAEEGMANRRVLELVRQKFKIDTGIVKIIAGAHSPHKIIEIPDRFAK